MEIKMTKTEKPKYITYNSVKEHLAYIQYAIDNNYPLHNGRCFDNSFLAAVNNIVSPKSWRYTEGVAIGTDGLLYYHAWLTSRKGKILDITWSRQGSTLYYPRYIFDAEKLFEIMYDVMQKPFTRYIYKGHTKFKDAVLEEGQEHPSFDYTRWSTMGQEISK